MFCAKEGKMLKNCFFVSVLTSVLIGLLVGKIESFPGCENSYFAGRNIALRQRAEQSGTYKTFVARKAVDGNTDTAFKSGSCAHTAKTMTSAWWRVYFDKPYTISGVIIYPRDDSRNARRLKDFEVTGYELSHNAYILYNDSTLQQYKKGVIKIKNDRYIRTKFNSLKISVPPRWHQTFDDGTSVLHLCEVQVYTYVLSNSKTTDYSDQQQGKQTAGSVTSPDTPPIPPAYVYNYDYDYKDDYSYPDYNNNFSEVFRINSTKCQDKTVCVEGNAFPGTKCYCDAMCPVLGDCCKNYAGNATSEITREQFECATVKEIIKTTGFGVHLVAKCSPYWMDTVTKHLCENDTDTDDIFLRLPVSDDSKLKMMFKNTYCAQCNYVDDIYYWNVEVKCRNETGVRTWSGMDEISLYFIRPRPEMAYRICQQEIIDTCDNDTYKNKCTHGQFYLMYDADGHPYRNEYCAYCNGTREGLTCEPPLHPEPPSATPDPRSYSFRYLVDFNAGTVDGNKEATHSTCDDNEEVFDMWSNQCRKIFCAPSFMLVNKKCVRKPLRSYIEPDNTRNCTLIKLNPHEYELINSSALLILSQNKLYTEEHFHTNGTDVFMCSDKLSPCVDDCSDAYVRFDLDDVESYMSMVGMILSLVSLTFTLCVYVAFPQLMNIPGKILICLIISLALAQFFFLIAPLTDDSTFGCIAVAVFVHYFFLSAFCWMNIIAIDLWLTFSNKFITPGAGSSRSKRFMFYSMYAWLAPIIIVGTALIVNFVEVNPDFNHLKPNYGNGLCWITTKYGLILFFVGPLAVFKILDITAFIFTSIQIARAQREGAMASQRKNVCSLLINIKLSLVMGLTWVFAYIALATNINGMWYLFIIFNSLQGLFIAICFLCTKKVGRLMYAKYERISTNFTSKTQLSSVE